jgi:hypothetical protein
MTEERKTDKTLTEFNEQQLIKTFTVDKESHNSTVFLTISIHWSEEEIKYTVYGELTQTVIIIPNDYFHTKRNNKQTLWPESSSKLY